MNRGNLRRFFILAVISFSGGVSFDLAYLRYIYEIPMVEFMGFSNTQVGLIMSTYGITAIVLYGPSGMLADKYSHRMMMTLGMLATGALGIIMAFYPPFWTMLLIQVCFGITTILMLWSVSIKAASLLGTDEEQGMIMGWMEGFRGVGVMALAVITMWIFSRIGPQNPASLRYVILIYSGVYFVLGVLCWFVVPDEKSSADKSTYSTDKSEHFSLLDVLTVLKRKTTWYCSAIIFGVFTIYATLSYSTGYLSEQYGMTVITASYMGVVINKIFRAICGPIGGLITMYSPIKSPTKVIQYGSILSAVAILVIIMVNASPISVVMGIALILVVTFVCMASRGLYWACIGEVKTPKYIIGTTVGVCSVIGFLPDVFVYPLVGYWKDTLPATLAYRNMWIMALLAMVVVFIATALLLREIKRNSSYTGSGKTLETHSATN